MSCLVVLFILLAENPQGTIHPVVSYAVMTVPTHGVIALVLAWHERVESTFIRVSGKGGVNKGKWRAGTGGWGDGRGSDCVGRGSTWVHACSLRSVLLDRLCVFGGMGGGGQHC